MKICVVAQEYPSTARPDVMAFVHARNLLYAQNGHEVVVLSFAAREAYTWDGIRVITERDLSARDAVAFDVFVFHAPNVRNHLRFMLRYRKSIRARAIIGHGHEFINWCEQVGRPFDFFLTPTKRVKVGLVRAYDRLKLWVWAGYLRRQRDSGLAVVFVSDWLRKNAESCLNLELSKVIPRVEIIQNPIHPSFEAATFDPSASKVADFVTIRSFDAPKYAIDVVVEIARRNPQWTFDIYGRGEYFSYNPAPPNVRVIRRKFRQSEMAAVLSQYRAALLPTRWDSQGVMMCEMACMGMPLIVSDLPICHAMVGEFENVSFVDNADPSVPAIPQTILGNEFLKHKFGFNNTVQRELTLFEDLIQERKKSEVFVGHYILSSVLSLLHGLSSLPLLRGLETRVRN